MQSMQSDTSSSAQSRPARANADRKELAVLSAELVLRLTVLSESAAQLLAVVRKQPQIRKESEARRSQLVAQLKRIERIGVRVRALLLSDPPLHTTRLLMEFGHDAIEAAMLTLSLLGAKAPGWARSARPLDLSTARARCFAELMHELSEDRCDRAQSRRLIALRDALTELGDCASEVTLIVSTD